MAKPNAVMGLWTRLSGLPGGKWLFSRLICFKAPYFSSVRPTFVALRPGYCEVTIPKRRAVTNHLGTVHAIAMCNLAELAAGTMTEVSIPASMRWLPKGMTVEYVKKAQGDIEATATVGDIAEGPGRDVPVVVEMKDGAGEVVCRATITMWVAPRKRD